MIWALFFGMIADALIGEPKWVWSRLPHPIVLIGKVISVADKRLNNGKTRKTKGIIFLLFLIVFSGVFGRLLTELGGFIEFFCVTILIAQKSLADHVGEVATSLRQSLEKGRYSVAQIVGRDTGEMDESQVARAAIESAAENFSDGVIAPIFWFLVAGLPGLIVYKSVNTADSMIGYKTPDYRDFGWASARYDDLLNWVPARLTSLLIALAGSVLQHRHSINRDAKLHRSPNAGWPEAAMAYALNVALAGPRSYDSQMQEFAWVNKGGNQAAKSHDIERTMRILWSSWKIALVIVGIVAIIVTF